MKKLKIPNQEQVWDGIAESWKERRAHPLNIVKEFLKDKKGKVLDLGCGSGRNILKSEDKEFYGVDFSEEQLKFAEKYAKKEKIKAEFVKSDAWKLPFSDGFFDSALYIATLHCIPDEENRKKAVKELARVLKLGGHALITVWDKESEKFKDMPQESYLNWTIMKGKKETKYKRYYYVYDKKEILDLLEKYFKVICIYSKEEKPIGKENKTQRRFIKRNLIIEVEKK